MSDNDRCRIEYNIHIRPWARPIGIGQILHKQENSILKRRTAQNLGRSKLEIMNLADEDKKVASLSSLKFQIPRISWWMTMDASIKTTIRRVSAYCEATPVLRVFEICQNVQKRSRNKSTLHADTRKVNEPDLKYRNICIWTENLRNTTLDFCIRTNPLGGARNPCRLLDMITD